MGRLTEVTETTAGSPQGQTVEAYTYDAVGNRLTGPGAADASTYNAGHQLLVGPAASYTYDANGNRTARSGAAGTTTYTWDPQDRLVEVSSAPRQGASTTVSFAYDHRGRRVRKTVSQAGGVPIVTDCVYDEDDVILLVTTPQATGATPTVTRVVHGPDVDEPVWLDQDGQLYVLHADALGSVRLVTDASQTVVERSAYSSFGVLARTGTIVRHPFAFTGREWDGEIGLYYYRARYYDPEVGRFLSRDPLGLATGPNPYAYVANSHTNTIDPTRTEPWWDNLDPWRKPPGHPCTQMPRWNTECFWLHYVHGNGQAVDLVEVGLLPALQTARDTKRIRRDIQGQLQQIAISRARGLCDDCDKGTKTFEFGIGETRYDRNFRNDDGLFVLAGGGLWAASACVGTANCQTRICSFTCATRFNVWDIFEDPPDCREMSQNRWRCDIQEASSRCPGSVPRLAE